MLSALAAHDLGAFLGAFGGMSPLTLQMSDADYASYQTNPAFPSIAPYLTAGAQTVVGESFAGAGDGTLVTSYTLDREGYFRNVLLPQILSGSLSGWLARIFAYDPTLRALPWGDWIEQYELSQNPNWDSTTWQDFTLFTFAGTGQTHFDPNAAGSQMLATFEPFKQRIAADSGLRDLVNQMNAEEFARNQAGAAGAEGSGFFKFMEKYFPMVGGTILIGGAAIVTGGAILAAEAGSVAPAGAEVIPSATGQVSTEAVMPLAQDVSDVAASDVSLVTSDYVPTIDSTAAVASDGSSVIDASATVQSASDVSFTSPAAVDDAAAAGQIPTPASMGYNLPNVSLADVTQLLKTGLTLDQVYKQLSAPKSSATVAATRIYDPRTGKWLPAKIDPATGKLVPQSGIIGAPFNLQAALPWILVGAGVIAVVAVIGGRKS